MDLARVRASLTRLAETDPSYARFGAGTHRYQPGSSIDPARLDAIENETGARLPDDFRAFLLDLGEAAAGPGYGLIPLDHPSQIDHLGSPFGFEKALWPGQVEKDFYEDDARLDGAVVLNDHGCGYTSVLVVHSARAQHGRVWLDVRGAGVGLLPTHASFTAWYEDWIRGSLHFPQLTPSPAPPSRCAPPNALTNYLGSFETKHGVAPGELTEEQVRQALLGIGDGGLATRSGEGRSFGAGDPVRPCSSCDAMVMRFVARGMMRPSQLFPGLPPRPARA